MPFDIRIAAAAALLLLAGCSAPPKPAAPVASTGAPARITQFYATAPSTVPGEKGLLCYGVENAKSVWLSPPRRELTVSLSRCVEVTPAETTTYTLTAEGTAGPPATKDVTVTMGPPRARIIEVKVNTVDLKAGDILSICYKVENARSVRIDPIRFETTSKPVGCTVDHPRQTTTYVVSARGAAGDQDQERVTVKVRE